MRKINNYKCMQQYNEFNKVVKQNGYYIYVINSENIETSDSHWLLLNLSDKIN